MKTDPKQEVQPRQAFKETLKGFEPLPLTQMDPILDIEIQNVIDNYIKSFKSI